MTAMTAMTEDGLTRPGITPAQRRFFDDNGYLVLAGFFPPERIAAVRSHIDALWSRRGAGGPFVIDQYIGDPSEQRRYFRDVEDAVRSQPYKLNDLHLDDTVIQHLCLDRRLVAVLGVLLGAPPLAINSLFLEYGSQQPAHFDTFYMPSKTPNMMAASWIAIDPVTDSNGPLFYYPGSHKVEPFRFSHGRLEAIFAEMPAAEAHMRRIAEASGLRPLRFHAQPGDVLIWHAQLLHGGLPILNKGETRTSLVTHYWTLHDHPDPADRIDIGEGQFVLRRPHQVVLDDAALAEIDAFLAALDTPPEHRAAAPPEFDARAYLLRNKDVFADRCDPYSHYHHHGRREGRAW